MVQPTWKPIPVCVRRNIMVQAAGNQIRCGVGDPHDTAFRETISGVGRGPSCYRLQGNQIRCGVGDPHVTACRETKSGVE
jgi:hypothetical protein